MVNSFSVTHLAQSPFLVFSSSTGSLTTAGSRSQSVLSSEIGKELCGTWVGCSLQTGILSPDGIYPSLAMLVTDAKTEVFDGPHACAGIARG